MVVVLSCHCRVTDRRDDSNAFHQGKRRFQAYSYSTTTYWKKDQPFATNKCEKNFRFLPRYRFGLLDLKGLRLFARGWLAYFKLAQIKTTFRNLDKWLRRRVRACYLKQWRKSKTRLKQLIKLGVNKRDALGTAKSGKGPWRLSRTVPVQRGLSIEFLAEQGLFNLEEYWESLHQ